MAIACAYQLSRSIENFFVTSILEQLEAQQIIRRLSESEAVFESRLDLHFATIDRVSVVQLSRNVVDFKVIVQPCNHFADVSNKASVNREFTRKAIGEMLDSLKNQ